MQWKCKECGCDDVEHAVWFNLNKEEAGEPFGSWCHGDNSYCNGCGEHTQLVKVENDERPDGAHS